MNELAECTLLAARLPAVAISLTQGKTAFISPEKVPLVTTGYTWAACRKNDSLWYAVARVRGVARDGGKPGRLVYMHVLISGGRGVDHRDRNGLNNTEVNLRPTGKSGNGANRGPSANNTSGFKGVSFHRRKNLWQAQITVRGQGLRLGYFPEKEEAARVYDDAATAHFGEFAATNVMLGLLSEEG